MHREPNPKERAAAANGDYGEWIEHEAEVNRDPAEYRVGFQEGYMTNAEMFRLIRRMTEVRHADVAANGCCKRMDEHGFCQYLQQQCPELVKGDAESETD